MTKEGSIFFRLCRDYYNLEAQQVMGTPLVLGIQES